MDRSDFRKNLRRKDLSLSQGRPHLEQVMCQTERRRRVISKQPRRKSLSSAD